MITKRIADRKDGQSSAASLLRYAEGLKVNPDGERLDKSLRTRISNFDLVDDVVLVNESIESREQIIALCATEMQANCDMNRRVDPDRKIAHFLVAFAQERPTDEMLDDIEDSMMEKLSLGKNHRSSFLHNDNGHWHLHIAVSRIDRDPPYRANVLRRDFESRDRVCREMELKYGLRRDKGIHRITDAGEIVVDESRSPLAFGVGDKAQSMERHAGLLSFQGWCIDTGFAAKMSGAETWKEMHQIAGQFDCRIAARGAGFIVASRGSDTHLAKLSQLGVKLVVKRLGEFQPNVEVVACTARYAPEPVLRQQGNRTAASAETNVLWERYKVERDAWNTNKNSLRKRFKADMREERNVLRSRLRDQKRLINQDPSLVKAEKEQLCSRVAMDAAQDEIILRERGKAGRVAIEEHAKAISPGDSFRLFLLKMAEAGDERALDASRQYALAEATSLIEQEEAEQRPASGAIGPDDDRIRIRHPILDLRRTVLRNGSVIYDLGGGRVLTDTAQGLIKLSAPAAFDREAVGAGLLLAQKRFGSKLTLHGSLEFQKFAVATAVAQNMGVVFADPKVEAYRLMLIRQKAGTKASAQTAEAEFPVSTGDPNVFESRNSRPLASASSTKTAPTASTEITFDARVFAERRNTLIDEGKIVDVRHRIGNETDLAKSVIFSELRSSARAEGPKLAVFATLDQSDAIVDKIVFAVDVESARRLNDCDRGKKLTVKVFKQERGLSIIEIAPERKRKMPAKEDVKTVTVEPLHESKLNESVTTVTDPGLAIPVKPTTKKAKRTRR
jgi:hypothetical protein